jgi:hypothetical protein
MYAKREWYARRGVLVVGPSPVFVDYISAVLPALGETSVRLAALGTLPDVPRGWEVDGWDDPTALAAKGSARMATLLRRVVRHLGVPRRVPDLEVARWGIAVSVRGSDLARRRSQVQRSARSHNGGRAAFATAATEVAWRAWERRPGATRSESDDRTDFESWLRTDPAFRRLLDTAWPVLLPEHVMARLQAGDLPLRELAGDLFDGAELAALQRWGPAAPPVGSRHRGVGTSWPSCSARRRSRSRTTTAGTSWPTSTTAPGPRRSRRSPTAPRAAPQPG